MKKIIFLLLLSFPFAFFAQVKNKKMKPILETKVTSMKHVTSIASRIESLPSAETDKREVEDGRYYKQKLIINKDPQKTDDYFTLNPNKLKNSVKGKTPSLVFDSAFSNTTPTDPSIAVGPNHVIAVFNTGFRIFQKDGTPITGQLSPNPTIFPDSGCCDLTVSYDALADRWVVSFLGSGAQIAVSDGPDPYNDGWYIYNVSSISDYQKLSIWYDGYYMTENTSSTNRINVLERDKMLVGDASAQVVSFPLPGIVTSGFNSPQALNISDDNYPTSGPATFVYLQDDAWAGVSQDHIKLWSLQMDWNNTSNSTISAATTLNTTPFISVFDNGSFSNLTQPFGGQDLDALQATVMNQAQFRKFTTHNSAVFNFVVDTDASTGKKAGVRWFELRQSGDGQPWSIYQEGTYTAPNNKHAWNASLIMDEQGNIGMGYTGMGGTNNKYVGTYYTGRMAGDPLNTMTVSETIIKEGTGNIPSTERYGDYSKIDIDPSDDKTFWFVDELYEGSRKNTVGVFRLAPLTTNDTGIVNIDLPSQSTYTNNESVTVTVHNYGDASQTNIPVSLIVNGTTVGSVVVPGPIAASSSLDYTFTNIDLSIEGQTYIVESCTNLSNDEDNTNDCTSTQTIHLNANDIGVIAITNPTSGAGLGSESITITIQNFGGSAQSNFPVSYSLDGNTPVSATVPGLIQPGATLDYTFSVQGDFSAFITHNLVATTNLSGDVDTSNDAYNVDIANISCMENMNDTVQNVGPNANTITTSIINIPNDFTINDVNVTIDVTHTYDFDLTIKLISPNGTEVILTDNQGSSGDNYTNTQFDDDATTPISSGTAPFTGTFSPTGSLADFNGEQSVGDWTLHITDGYTGDGGTLNSWTLQVCGDMTADVSDNILNDSDLIVTHDGNNQYHITLESNEFNQSLNFSVSNIVGQTLLVNKLDNIDGKYHYDLDMSYATPGIYIINLGDSKIKKTRKIIVK